MVHNRRDRALILMYHRVAELGEEPDLHALKVTPSNFDRHIRYLQRKYRIISLPDLLDQIAGRSLHPDGQVVITFDDGYADNYAYAYPILKKHGAPATIFLPTDYVDGKAGPFWWERLRLLLWSARVEEVVLELNPPQRFQLQPETSLLETYFTLNDLLIDMKPQDRDEFLVMLQMDIGVQQTGTHMAVTWTQVREMSDQGILFGSHTCSHPSLSRLSVEEIRDELMRSKREIELRTGRKVDTFAYPYGDPQVFNETCKAILKQLDYRCACSTIHGFVDKDTDLYALKRLMVKNWKEGDFAAKIRDTLVG